MADFITIFHEDSDKLAKFAGFNLFDKDSLFEAKQTSKEGSPSNNEDSTLCDNNASYDPSISKTSILKSNQKKVISVSSISGLSTLQSHKPNVPLTDLAKIKISALLYEITERTTRLAQFRSCVTETEASQKPLKCGISKPTSRILELACSKVIHDSPTKPINFVSPSALKAIDVRNLVYDVKINEIEARKNFLRIALNNRKLNMKLKHEKLTYNLLQLDSDRNARRMRKRLERGNKSEIWKKTRKHGSSYYLNNTNSDRSIVLINLD
ncbi:uncharacterized protein [Polyergus mexicanus]|uniref:uncharacterized protein n=1 Tax=Polyergus mexicanus TaxID=615972 RepID=UPI0038B68380